MLPGRCRGIQVLQDELHQGGVLGVKPQRDTPLPRPFVTSCHPAKPLHAVPVLGCLHRAERGRSSFRMCWARSGGLG